MPPTPTTRAPSVLGVCGWVSAPRTALSRVYRRLVCSLGVSALPRRVVRRTTIPWSSPRALTHALRARREGAGRPHRPYPPPTSPRSPRRATPLSHKQCLHPCTPLTLGRAPAFDTTQPPRRDDAREVHAGRGRRGRTVRGDCPRSGGHHLGVVCLGAQYGKYPVFNPRAKDTNSARSRRGAPASGARRAVRAALGDAAAPFRWRTGSMDGGASRRSFVVPSRRVPQCHGWRCSSRHMCSLGSSCAPLAEGLHPTRWACTTCTVRPRRARLTRRAPYRSQAVRSR